MDCDAGMGNLALAARGDVRFECEGRSVPVEYHTYMYSTEAMAVSS